MSGSAIYGNKTSFNLALGGRSVRVRQNGVRAVVDANLAWSGTTTASNLGGRVTVDKLSFNQGSDLAEIISQLSGDNTVSDSSSSTHSVKLNVAVQSSNNLNLKSSQLSIGGSANLNVVGNLADPIILGRIALTSGEVFFPEQALRNSERDDCFCQYRANRTGGQPVRQYGRRSIHDHDQFKRPCGSPETLPTLRIHRFRPRISSTFWRSGRPLPTLRLTRASPGSLGAESAVASAAGQSGGVTGSKIDWHISTDLKPAGRQ